MDSPTYPGSIPQPLPDRQPLAAAQRRLLDLNRAFYVAVADEFDRTRQGLPTGMVTLVERLAAMLAGGPPAARVLDVGCGNGRFARALAGAGVHCRYTGIDADSRLLGLAEWQATGLAGIDAMFAARDLAEPGWQAGLDTDYNAVVCLAVLHHFPGSTLRQALVRELAALLAPTGVLALSTWQFLATERLATKQVDWAEVGVDPAQLEPGDALLPWNQGVHALRYVHQLDLAEIEALAAGAGLTVADTFRADGKEGNLNLYVLLTRPAG